MRTNAGASAWALGLLGLLAGQLALSACGSNPEAAEPVIEDESRDAEYDRSGIQPIVIGTAIEASTGRLLAGVEVMGPEGQKATTDADGHFELRGLSRGNKCMIKAVSEAGLKGENQLRCLTGGRLEVVIYLR